MKFLPLLLRILAALVLGLLLLAGTGLWALQSEWGHQRVTKLVRQRLAAHSDLVLAPLKLDYSLLRDFPYLTASLHHLSLTDTSARRAVQVRSRGAGARPRPWVGWRIRVCRRRARAPS